MCIEAGEGQTRSDLMFPEKTHLVGRAGADCTVGAPVRERAGRFKLSSPQGSPAYRTRGHSADLNFGDCVTFASAKAARAPLLFEGADGRQRRFRPSGDRFALIRDYGGPAFLNIPGAMPCAARNVRER